jgi:hypothetical protein
MKLYNSDTLNALQINARNSSLLNFGTSDFQEHRNTRLYVIIPCSSKNKSYDILV